MATKRHSNDDEIPPTKAGGSVAQSIVELLSATASGLVFWSRHPFEVADEVQLRVRGSTLAETSEWVTKRGFVVQCKPGRRSNGSVGFKVSVLFVSASTTRAPTHEMDPDRMKRLSGLN